MLFATLRNFLFFFLENPLILVLLLKNADKQFIHLNWIIVKSNLCLSTDAIWDCIAYIGFAIKPDNKERRYKGCTAKEIMEGLSKLTVIDKFRIKVYFFYSPTSSKCLCSLWIWKWNILIWFFSVNISHPLNRMLYRKKSIVIRTRCNDINLFHIHVYLLRSKIN